MAYRGDPRSQRRWKRLRARILATHPGCHWCGEPATTVDHLNPVATHPHLAYDLANLVPACTRCNMSRGADRDGTWHARRRESSPKFR